MCQIHRRVLCSDLVFMPRDDMIGAYWFFNVCMFLSPCIFQLEEPYSIT